MSSVPSRFKVELALREAAMGSRAKRAERVAMARSVGGGAGSDPSAVHTGDAAGGDLGGTYPNPTVPGLAGKQPLDADLTAIALLSTTTYGRALLTLANQVALQTAVGVGAAGLLGVGTGLESSGGNLRLSAQGSGISGGAGSLLSVDTSLIATRAYADSLAQGLDVKASCRAATTGPITISTGLNNGDAIDGVTLVTGDRVLVKDQSTASQNGIYVVGAVPARATDADVDAEVTSGLFTFVSEGAVNADSGWVLTTNDPITVGSTSLAFSQFSGAGQIVAGAALTKSGNTLDVAVDGITIEISGDAVRVKALGITDAHVAAANKDGAAGTPSMRTLGSGAAQAAAGNDSRIPTQGQKDALALSFGTPSSTNRAVSMDDPVWDSFGLQPGQGAIAHDASSNHAGGTGDLSWTHTPVGTPAGIIVQIAQTASGSKEASGVTYGGVPMQEVHYPVSDITELGAVYTYFLGYDIPTGPQTVLVTVTGGSSKRAVAHSVTSGLPVRAAAVASAVNSTGANPSVTLALPTAMEAAVYGLCYSGQDAVTGIAAGAGYTEVLEHDFGAQVASWIRRTANTTGGDTAVSWTATTEDSALVGVALTQVLARDYGRVSALPPRGTIGDTISVVVEEDTAGTRQVWEFMYEADTAPASGFPWRFVGGSPIHAQDNDARTRNANSFAALATDPISRTIPFDGDYDILIGAGIACAAGATASLSYAKGAIAASDLWAAKVNAAAAIYGTVVMSTPQFGLNAGDVIAEQAKSTTGTSTFENRRLELTPIRIG